MTPGAGTLLPKRTDSSRSEASPGPARKGDYQGWGHQELWFTGDCPCVSLPVSLLEELTVLLDASLVCSLNSQDVRPSIGSKCAARRDELGIRLLHTRTSRSCLFHHGAHSLFPQLCRWHSRGPLSSSDGEGGKVLPSPSSLLLPAPEAALPATLTHTPPRAVFSKNVCSELLPQEG